MTTKMKEGIWTGYHLICQEQNQGSKEITVPNVLCIYKQY